MAIRFVDVEPDTGKGAAKAKTAKPATPPAAHAPEPVENAIPALPLAKPEPKARTRKKPVAVEAQTAEPAASGAEAASADGLLPGLQIHAKPTPKPRGRKKAFG